MKIRQYNNIFYYWCECGVEGKQIFRPIVEAGVLVTAVRCAMCGCIEQVVLRNEELDIDSMSWVPFRVRGG